MCHTTQFFHYILRTNTQNRTMSSTYLIGTWGGDPPTPACNKCWGWPFLSILLSVLVLGIHTYCKINRPYERGHHTSTYYICALVDELHMQFHAVLIYTAAKYLHIHRHKQITYRLGLNIFMQGKEGIVTRYVLIKVILTVCLFKLSNTF